MTYARLGAKIGPLYAYMVQKITPCWMANDAEGKKNKEITSFKKHISFLFTFPLRRCHPARCFFFTMWPCSAKALYRAVNSIAWIDLMYGSLYSFFQRFYSVLNSPGRPLTMHFLQVLSDHSSLIRCVNSVRRTLSYQQTLNGWSSHVSTSARRRTSAWYPSLMWTLFTRMNSWAAPTGLLSRL